MDEVVSRIVDYAYPGKEGAFEISRAAGHNCVRIEITDTGTPVDPNAGSVSGDFNGSQEDGIGLFPSEKIHGPG